MGTMKPDAGASVKDCRMEKISIGEIFCFELREPRDVMVGKEFSAQFISLMVLRPSPRFRFMFFQPKVHCLIPSNGWASLSANTVRLDLNPRVLKVLEHSQWIF